MASSSSPKDELPPTETLNLYCTQMNGHDSYVQPPPPNPDQIQPSNSPSTDATTAVAADVDHPSGKRKRDEEPAELESTKDPSLNPLYKTSLCSYFRRHSGSCSHGSSCKYAHGEEELRPRPDNTWDPTSERAKKAMKLENDGGGQCQGKVVEEIMMTDVVSNDGDGDGDGGGGCLDPGLSKCLVHLPRKWSSDNLKKFLNDQGVLFKHAKKKKGMAVGFVSFENVEQLKSAVEELEGRSVGNNKIKVADVIPRTYDQKIKSAMAFPQQTQVSESALDRENVVVSKSSGGLGDDANDDDSVQGSSVSRGKCVHDVVTPLAHMPYEEQLEHKKSSVTQMLKRLTRSARKACPNGVSLPEWILKSREIGGLPCELVGILESPLINGYRNKCEFSTGYSLQGKPTVGFMLGNFREGVTAVEEPVDCPNVSRIACKYALIFQEFLQQSSLPIWNRFKNTGFWRQLTVREGRLPGKPADVEKPEVNISEVMLIVQVRTVGFDDDLITSEVQKLANTFVAGAAASFPVLPLTALVLQDHQGISNVAPSDSPLRILLHSNADSGSTLEETKNGMEARIHDHISNLQFAISPTAFFQVNTLAAEKLYSLAGDWAGLGPNTLLFDICCGTGTIGLTLAHRVGMVVGIEMNASAVSDAHQNAEINGIKNCRFVCGKAEDVMGSLLKEYLNVPQKQDDLQDASESVDKNISTDNALATNDNSSHQLENGGGTHGCGENSEQESQSHHERNCTLKGGSLVPQFENIVAIVDPPRGGLHPTVIKVLRTHSRLQRLVYISCNPETLVANAIELCTPSPEKVEKGNKNSKGWRNMSSAGLARHRVKSMPISEPFRPVKAMAVDLFPHTVHCEMVMLLDR